MPVPVPATPVPAVPATPAPATIAPSAYIPPGAPFAPDVEPPFEDEGLEPEDGGTYAWQEWDEEGLMRFGDAYIEWELSEFVMNVSNDLPFAFLAGGIMGFVFSMADPRALASYANLRRLARAHVVRQGAQNVLIRYPSAESMSNFPADFIGTNPQMSRMPFFDYYFSIGVLRPPTPPPMYPPLEVPAPAAPTVPITFSSSIIADFN